MVPQPEASSQDAQPAVQPESAAAPAQAGGPALVTQVRLPAAIAFSRQLVRGFDRTISTSTRLSKFVERFFCGSVAYQTDVEFVLAPFAPPLRQISSVRQGALPWGDSAPRRRRPAPPSGTPGMISADMMARMLGMANDKSRDSK